MSASPPAIWTAANTPATTNDSSSPTSRFSTSSAATWIGWPGMCWPCMAMPVRPIANPAAIVPLTGTGIIFEEKNGATTNSGVMRASTRKNPVTGWPPPSVWSTWLSVSWLIRSATGSTCTGSGRR